MQYIRSTWPAPYLSDVVSHDRNQLALDVHCLSVQPHLSSASSQFSLSQFIFFLSFTTYDLQPVTHLRTVQARRQRGGYAEMHNVQVDQRCSRLELAWERRERIWKNGSDEGRLQATRG